MRVVAIFLASLTLLSAGLPAASAAEYQIINGRPADPGAWPAMAAITTQDFQFCGGTLIDPEWVVTAAHCFFDSRTGGSSLAPQELELVLDTNDWTEGGERVGVDQIIIHPEYDEFATVNDITLLHLTQRAAATPNPVVAANEAGLYAPGRTATVIGYGTTTPYGENPSNTLLEVDVPLVADGPCTGSYPNLVADRHVCAGAPGSEANPGPDTCQGDSGGPIFTQRGDGTEVLIGITSFGGLCGVQDPGVYTELITYLDWVNGMIGGTMDPNDPTDPTTPDLPDDWTVEPNRIVSPLSTTGSDPVLQAVEISFQTFTEGQADYAVLATAGRYPDALGGSSLAFGIAPLLFTSAAGTLDDVTIRELQRAVKAGSVVYVLGGSAAVPESVDAQLQALGFVPVRLAGPTREGTAAAVAQEIFALNADVLPQARVIVATSANWPDAVTVGQIGSWWGIPVLLTPPDQLHDTTAQLLAQLAPSEVLVIGGTAAISDGVAASIEAITGPGSVTRLGGSTRFGTAQAVTEYNLDVLYRGVADLSPQYIIAVNLRREADAFAHVLAASMLTGAFAGVFAPVEGETGTDAPQEVLQSVCGLDVPVLIAGGTDLVATAASDVIQGAAGGAGCESQQDLQLGDLVISSITQPLPVRSFTFAGVAGQVVRIRMDAAPSDENVVDPILQLFGPDGTLVAENDDEVPGSTLNAFVETTLPVDGVYRIDATSFQASVGQFVLSLDPAPVFEDADELSAEQREVIYEADLDPGTRVIVEMRAVPGSATDPLLVAYDDAGNEIGFDDDSGGYPNARMEFVAPGGTIEILATSFDENSVGPFELAIFEP